MVTLNDDDQKHKDALSDEDSDEESALGSEVKSGADDVDNVDDIDASIGIYADDSKEVNIAEQIEEHNEG